MGNHSAQCGTGPTREPSRGTTERHKEIAKTLGVSAVYRTGRRTVSTGVARGSVASATLSNVADEKGAEALSFSSSQSAKSTDHDQSKLRIAERSRRSPCRMTNLGKTRSSQIHQSPHPSLIALFFSHSCQRRVSKPMSPPRGACGRFNREPASALLQRMGTGTVFNVSHRGVKS